MATQSADPDTEVGFDLQEFLGGLVNAYRYMEISAERYALLVLFPALVFAAAALSGAVLFGLPPVVAIPLALLGVLAAAVAVVYPKILQDQKRKQIRERFHLFLTHITVLSMTNIDRVEVFRTLADIDEYGALATEMSRIVALVDTWNQSLDDACRMRAEQVSSDLLADFLERLAYTVGAGQQISEFLTEEQDSMIQQFVIRYESDLAKLDVLQELYLSLMLSTTFILVFSTVLPLLVGVPPTFTVGGVVVMFAFVQGGFVFVIHTIAPWDPVWYHADADGSPIENITVSLVLGVLGLVALTGLVVLVKFGLFPLHVVPFVPPDFSPDDIPLPFYLAIPTTPLLVPAIAMRREEEKVKDRDRGFPSFIRALGNVESVKQTSTANVLETLRMKDFGALTKNIDNLYKRLNTRIDTTASWELFAIETGSYLIQKFSGMYVAGRRMGGEPRALGQVISQNFNEVLRVREQREQATTTFIGVLYGLTAASIFASFIGLEIAEQMIGIAKGISDSNDELVSTLFHTAMYDIEAIEFLLLAVLLVNALLSSLMIRIVDRGHTINAYLHFVLLTWLGAVTAVVTRHVVGNVISV